MPDELRDLLTERARASGRSLNAEIIAILQDAVAARQQALAGLDVDTLAEALAPKLADEIATKVAAKMRGGA